MKSICVIMKRRFGTTTAAILALLVSCRSERTIVIGEDVDSFKTADECQCFGVSQCRERHPEHRSVRLLRGMRFVFVGEELGKEFLCIRVQLPNGEQRYFVESGHNVHQLQN